MSFSIEGRTAIVTGAANGVGLAIARHFAAQGAQVVMADRDEEHLAEEAGKLAEEGAKAVAFAGDLRDRLTLANLVSMARDEFERVDILVNAARRVELSDPLDPKGDLLEDMLAHNLMPALRLSQLVARQMIEQARDSDAEAGAIVNVSSIAAQRTRPELMGYSVATAALDQLTRSLAVALAPHRIRVNGVAFGSVMSARLRDVLRGRPELRQTIVEATPLGRIGQAGELAEAVQYLVSSGASFVTGAVLTVDGGRSLVDAACAPVH